MLARMDSTASARCVWCETIEEQTPCEDPAAKTLKWRSRTEQYEGRFPSVQERGKVCERFPAR